MPVITRFALKLHFGGRILLVAAVLMAIAVPNALGQASTGEVAQVHPVAIEKPVFDIASIRENVKSTDGRTHIYRHPEDGQFIAINASMRVLLQFAFEMPDAQILNGPEWLGARNFDVQAKADGSVDEWIHTLDSDHAKATKEKMVQALLADRFKLVAHQETRELPVFALVLAKGGAKLKEAKGGAKFDGGRGQITDQGASMIVLADQL
jgi:uncharacterized protein (TIGR03435 family)